MLLLHLAAAPSVLAVYAMPHISPSDIAPQDVLHLFPDGLLRSEGAWLLCVLGRLGLRLELVNNAIAAYSNFPPDVRVPAIRKNILECNVGGTPKSESVLRMSGSQTMYFTLHKRASAC